MTSVLSTRWMQFLMLFLSLCLLTGCESRRTIVNGLDEKEANEILVYLSSKGIDATKIQAASEGGGGAKTILWNISVEDSKANEAMAMLNQVGLPRRRGQSLLGIFSTVGLVPSSMEQKVRFQAGLAEQIASTIRKIDGVLDADVQISFPEEDPLNPAAQKQKITASVYVKHSGVLDDPNANLVSRIKRLVSGSIVGLDYNNVTVIGDRARFTDLPSVLSPGAMDEEKSYVNVWSVIVAKESLTRFRFLFFSFTILILLLTLLLLWLIWKTLPILKEAGLKKLMGLHPLEALTAEKKAEEAEKEKKSEEPKKPSDDNPEDGPGFDVT